MSFADIYLSKQNLKFPTTAPNNDLSGAVVIPCYSEPNITHTLFSLLKNNPTKGSFEIIVVVNYPENAPKEAESDNRQLFDSLLTFANHHQTPQRVIRPLWLGSVARKKAGAGYARKVGMDLAVSLFNHVTNPDGIILSLDADTTTCINYLAESELAMLDPSVRQILFPFEHPKENLSDDFRKAIVLYEMHLRYYRLALQTIGWPWPYHTIGSAFGVRASVYAEQNGMNTKTAGEDFYFLNKLFPHGGTKIVKNCRVYPEARLSNRVPFGTGPAMQQILQNNLKYTTYCFESFKNIEYFVANASKLFGSTISIKSFIDKAPEPLRQFWISTSMESKIMECLIHSASEKTFTKRLFRKFDAFQLVKFLNFAHDHFYQKLPVEEETQKLLCALRIPVKDNCLETLSTLLQQADESIS